MLIGVERLMQNKVISIRFLYRLIRKLAESSDNVEARPPQPRLPQALSIETRAKTRIKTRIKIAR